MASTSIESVSPVDSDKLYEVINGEVVELTPIGVYEGLIATLLSTALQNFVVKKYGRIAAEVLFDFTRVLGHKRRPDLAFVSFDRWPREKPSPRAEAWSVVPNLAVEVVSPTNPANEVVGKIAEYFQVGVERVWVVYPSQQQLYVYASPTDVRVLTANDDLTDDALLPGFRLRLKELFDDTAASGA